MRGQRPYKFKVGQILSYFTILDVTKDRYQGNSRHVLILKCICGQIAKRPAALFAMDPTKYKVPKSCGCVSRLNSIKATTVHGHTKTINYKRIDSPTWTSWASMKTRCSRNSKTHDRPTYKNIIIEDPRWNLFTNFLADMGERPNKTFTLDRINNSRGYCKENCRWATWLEQSNNRTNNRWVEAFGLKLTVAQWVRKLHVNSNSFRTYLRTKTIEEFVTRHHLENLITQVF